MLYTDRVRDHYYNPRYKGRVSDHTFLAVGTNPACGDTSEISGVITNGVIVKIGQQGEGCMISQAAASLLAEYSYGKKVKELQELTAREFIDFVGLDVGPQRARCVLLALEALHVGITNYAGSR